MWGKSYLRKSYDHYLDEGVIVTIQEFNVLFVRVKKLFYKTIVIYFCANYIFMFFVNPFYISYPLLFDMSEQSTAHNMQFYHIIILFLSFFFCKKINDCQRSNNYSDTKLSSDILGIIIIQKILNNYLWTMYLEAVLAYY